MNIGRNDPCPCGSGKKYKKCCLAKDEEARRKETAPLLVSAPVSTTEPPPRHKDRPKPPPDPRVENLDVDRALAIVGYLSGGTERRWTMDDFKLAPPKRRSRDDWDDEEGEEASEPDPAKVNLYDLLKAFDKSQSDPTLSEAITRWPEDADKEP